jgi:GH15 family glucan-1,4-alpha-glucosidase
MQPELSDYALIGNCRSAALVSKYGSIDWCCLPEFDSQTLFAALLDRQTGGYFSISPVDNYTSAQQYISETNVVETNFNASDGEVRLLDAFTAMTETEKATSLFPDHEILRIVEGIHGNVRMKMQYRPRTFYGSSRPVLKNYHKLGIRFFNDENIYTLLSSGADEIHITGRDNADAELEFVIGANERVIFSLSHCSQNPIVLPELKLTGLKRMERTITFWKAWSQQCKYSGLYAQQVKRSALVLKLLTYAPSGAIIAAPTTSLPETPGGESNWDYRYCWLRDASFTTRALLSLGFEDETHAYMNWILHATALTRPKLQVVYSVFGEARLKEKTLPWLSGYRNSIPVRIGNKADQQFQLDVYGEVLDAAFSYSALVPDFDYETKRFLISLGRVICKIWDQPDQGIWEVRTGALHHTHSKVMVWVGLDRLLKLSRKYDWHDAPVTEFKETADKIRRQVEEFGYNRELKTYTGTLNGNSLDASTLTFSLVGYADPGSDKMTSTVDMIKRHLTTNDLVFRNRDNDDTVSSDEGTFGICNFWLAENLAKAGKVEEAMLYFDKMLAHSSPTGLLSEELDPASGELLGNYPQGFSHIGLINAALSINNAYQKNISKG